MAADSGPVAAAIRGRDGAVKPAADRGISAPNIPTRALAYGRHGTTVPLASVQVPVWTMLPSCTLVLPW